MYYYYFFDHAIPEFKQACALACLIAYSIQTVILYWRDGRYQIRVCLMFIISMLDYTRVIAYKRTLSVSVHIITKMWRRRWRYNVYYNVFGEWKTSEKRVYNRLLLVFIACRISVDYNSHRRMQYDEIRRNCNVRTLIYSGLANLKSLLRAKSTLYITPIHPKTW